MFNKGQRINALIKLSGKGVNVTKWCNDLCEKQEEKCKKLSMDLEWMEKLHPKTYLMNKKWRELLSKYVVEIERWGYYCEIVARELKQSKEFLKKADEVKI